VSVLPHAVASPLADTLAVDRLDALYAALRAVGRGGTVSLSGVYGGEVDPMPMMEMVDRGIQLRMGQAHVKRWIEEIMPLVCADDDGASQPPSVQAMPAPLADGVSSARLCSMDVRQM